MTIIDQGRLVNGTFTFKDNTAADFGGLNFPARPTSAFTEQSPAHQEAADAYFEGRPWANAEDFEDALFDTFDSEAEYYAGAQNPDEGLYMVLDHIEPIALPSGAIAVLYKN
jgi:protein-disulfide isomerase